MSGSVSPADCSETCDVGAFQCNNCVCIPADWVCDDTTDCLNGEDERANCSTYARVDRSAQ